MYIMYGDYVSIGLCFGVNLLYKDDMNIALLFRDQRLWCCCNRWDTGINLLFKDDIYEHSFIISRPKSLVLPVFENTYFSFFSDLKKMTFTFFLNDSEKRRKKSVAKLLSSMMLTLLQKKEKSLLNVYRNFGLKTPHVMGLHTFLCPHFWARYSVFDVGDRNLTVLTSSNWVIKGWVIKWPVKLRTF